MAKIKKKDLKAWIEEQRRRINNAMHEYPLAHNFYSGKSTLLCELERDFNLEDKE